MERYNHLCASVTLNATDIINSTMIPFELANELCNVHSIHSVMRSEARGPNLLSSYLLNKSVPECSTWLWNPNLLPERYGEHGLYLLLRMDDLRVLNRGSRRS